MKRNKAKILLLIAVFAYCALLYNINFLNSQFRHKDNSGSVMFMQSKEVKAAASQARTSDEQLIARAVNGEARGEPYIGKVAVAAVILNRTKDPRFPKTISGVIYQAGAFTAVSDGQINLPVDANSDVLKATRDAMNGWDPTEGCVYYFNPATATNKWIWSRPIVTKIGKHNFAK